MYTEAAVIGGGAAGFMAAVTAKANGLDIIIMERKHSKLSTEQLIYISLSLTNRTNSL